MPTTAGTPTSVPGRLLTGWHTSVDDGHAHAVTDAAFADGVRQRRGEFTTVCELVICTAALVAPCGRACPRCTQVLHTHAATHPPAHSAPPRRRLRWPWSLPGRHALPAATHAGPGA